MTVLKDKANTMENVPKTVVENNPEEEGQIARIEYAYENLSSKYIRKESVIGRQYFLYYRKRLEIMQPRLEAAARKKWGKSVKIEKLDQLNEYEDSCVIGSIFKHMELQYSILKEICEERNLESQPIRSRYTSDTDKLYLEDDMQRVPIQGNDILKADDFVTGVIVALKGRELDGVFDVNGICFINPTEYLERPLIEEDKYVAIVSGLAFARASASLHPFKWLIRLLTGDSLPTSDIKLPTKVTRLIIAGNSVSYAVDDSPKTNKYSNSNPDCKVVEGVEMLDKALEELTASMCVDVMPGENDPTTIMLPQQPIHRCIFPQSSRQNLKTVTNPYEFSVDGTRFLGTSGQNVASVRQYSTMDESIEVMEKTLKWGYLFPTCPDVLPSYPFLDTDPFIMSSLPHVYFVGNQPSFGTKLFKGEDGNTVRLISIPPFHKSFTCALLNLRNLDCLPLIAC